MREKRTYKRIYINIYIFNVIVYIYGYYFPGLFPYNLICLIYYNLYRYIRLIYIYNELNTRHIYLYIIYIIVIFYLDDLMCTYSHKPCLYISAPKSTHLYINMCIY